LSSHLIVKVLPYRGQTFTFDGRLHEVILFKGFKFREIFYVDISDWEQLRSSTWQYRKRREQVELLLILIHEYGLFILEILEPLRGVSQVLDGAVRLHGHNEGWALAKLALYCDRATH
jgi:hypothetical protein